MTFLRPQVSSPADIFKRREVLGLAGAATAGVAAWAMLSRHAGGADEHEPASHPAAVPDRLATGDSERLNFALNLAYLGAQFHRRAATGEGLSADLLAGIGDHGSVLGGRRVAFSSPDLAEYASEFADDQVAQVAALRRQLGRAAAAQPSIDLRSGPRAAFSVAGRAARVVREAAVFDPFSSDGPFLLGAFLIGNRLAAVSRMLLAGVADSGARTLLAGILADAIYHDGLIRSLLAAKAVADPTIGRAMASVSAMQLMLDGPHQLDGNLSAAGAGGDLIDAEGHRMPFFRSPAQVVRSLCLTAGSSGKGGFFPRGLNGIASLS